MCEVDGARLTGLLDAFDVVCVTPPVADIDGGTALNVDADVLAAEAATALGADHLRLVTGTAGLLTDPLVPTSTLRYAVPGEGQRYATGWMLQKVRAAEIALAGTCDIAITGPDTLSPANATWFRRAPAPVPDLVPARSVEPPSVATDEREIAGVLAGWCVARGIPAHLDAAGNLVVTKGSRPGRLDTPPHRWPVLFAWEHHPADAVIVGEPSGAEALAIGCHDLAQVRLRVEALRIEIALLDQGAAVVIVGTHAVNRDHIQTGQAVVCIRMPQRLAVAEFRCLMTVLTAAVGSWIAAQPAGTPAVPAAGTANTDR